MGFKIDLYKNGEQFKEFSGIQNLHRYLATISDYRPSQLYDLINFGIDEQMPWYLHGDKYEVRVAPEVREQRKNRKTRKCGTHEKIDNEVVIVGAGQSGSSFTGEKKSYNKLVRDRIPTIIASRGDSCRITVLDKEQYKSELRIKLMEEIEEYYLTDHDEEALTELADVLEVIMALSKVHGSTPEQLESKRVEKQKQRGGFEDRMYLIDTTVH